MMTTNVWVKQVGAPQYVLSHVPFQFCNLNSPSFVTTSFLTGVAWLQATLGPPRIWKCHIHPDPLGAHLEARYCPLQQVSVSTVTRGQSHPWKFSLPMASRCFLKLSPLVLFSVVEVHVDSRNICTRRALNDVTNIHHKGFFSPNDPFFGQQVLLGDARYCFLFTCQRHN